MPKPLNVSRSKEKKRKLDYFAFAAIAIIVAAAIVIPIRKHYGMGFVVASNYMERSLFRGDFVFVKYAGPDDEFTTGDVVAFEYPPERSQYRFGRIVATAGQTVQVYKKRLYVDNIEVPEPSTVIFTDEEIEKANVSLRDYFGPFDVPQESYFIMGDNRDESVDSRNWGALERGFIIGKPTTVYFSWKPDPNAPKIHSPINVIDSFFYNLFHALSRIGFNRIGKKVK